jgi:hypothetical protein
MNFQMFFERFKFKIQHKLNSTVIVCWKSEEGIFNWIFIILLAVFRLYVYKKLCCVEFIKPVRLSVYPLVLVQFFRNLQAYDRKILESERRERGTSSMVVQKDYGVPIMKFSKIFSFHCCCACFIKIFVSRKR